MWTTTPSVKFQAHFAEHQTKKKLTAARSQLHCTYAYNGMQIVMTSDQSVLFSTYAFDDFKKFWGQLPSAMLNSRHKLGTPRSIPKYECGNGG